MALDDLNGKINAVERFDIVQHTTEIINANSEYLLFLLRSQLQEGRNSRGEEIKLFDIKTGVPRNYYSDVTIRKKDGVPGLGGIIDRITNYMSGTFYHTLEVITKGEEFEIFSPVSYFEKILNQNTTEIMELNQENGERFREEILAPQLEARFKAHFNV